jgi:hypothetical protein
VRLGVLLGLSIMSASTFAFAQSLHQTASTTKFVVPVRTNIYFDQNKKPIPVAKITGDCVQTPCPSTFDKDIVCWICQKRLSNVASPTTNAPP